MTTIVGIQGDGFAVICTDSRISNDGGTGTLSTLGQGMNKVAQNGPYLIGAAGDVRAINILHHAFTPPTPTSNLKGKKLDAFITVKFIPALRECLEKQGYSYFDKDSNFTANFDSTIITVIHSTIYVIDGDYSWASDSNGTYAIGSGSDYALGAMNVLMPKNKLTGTTAKTIWVKALATASKYEPGTGAPYHTFLQESTPTKRVNKTTQPKVPVRKKK